MQKFLSPNSYSSS